MRQRPCLVDHDAPRRFGGDGLTIVARTASALAPDIIAFRSVFIASLSRTGCPGVAGSWHKRRHRIDGLEDGHDVCECLNLLRPDSCRDKSNAHGALDARAFLANP